MNYKENHPRRLTLGLIPSTCWYSNLRSTLPQNVWETLKRRTAGYAHHRCEICGGQGQGNHPVECHEKWEYDTATKTQRLVGLLALCPPCHEVKHFGLARIRGFAARALAHYCKVNQVNTRVAEAEVRAEFDIWARRSEHPWNLDISWLVNEGIDVLPVIEASKRAVAKP